MPSRKLVNEERQYRDMCHPLNSKVREELTDAVFAAYDEFIETKNRNKVFSFLYCPSIIF